MRFRRLVVEETVPFKNKTVGPRIAVGVGIRAPPVAWEMP
jgi:hypothetical protein